MRENLLEEIKSFLEDYELEDIDTTTDIYDARSYAGDAYQLLQEVKLYLENENGKN